MMFIDDAQRERVATQLAWKYDLAVEAGLWQAAAILERKLQNVLRPGERIIGREIRFSSAWL